MEQQSSAANVPEIKLNLHKPIRKCSRLKFLDNRYQLAMWFMIMVYCPVHSYHLGIRSRILLNLSIDELVGSLYPFRISLKSEANRNLRRSFVLCEQSDDMNEEGKTDPSFKSRREDSMNINGVASVGSERTGLFSDGRKGLLQPHAFDFDQPQSDLFVPIPRPPDSMIFVPDASAGNFEADPELNARDGSAIDVTTLHHPKDVDVDVDLSGTSVSTSTTEFSTTTVTDRVPLESSPKDSLAAADDALAIAPEIIDIIPIPISPEEERLKNDAAERFLKSSYGQYPFVNMFRSSAVYIAQHRNAVMVFHIGGELLEWGGNTIGPDGSYMQPGGDGSQFADLMNDIALTWLLGTKVVIVVGCRCFVDRRLVRIGAWPPERHLGVRVTNLETLRIVKEEAGFVRFEVERQLARALRKGISYVGGGDQTPPNVVSGNFYSAQPFGIVDGVDHQYTGLLRRVEKEKIRQAHAAGDIVLLTNLGASPSGELFNVNSESLASGVAGALKASKIIFFSLAGSELRHIDTDKHIQGLRYSDAERLLDYNGVTVRRGGYAMIESDTEQHPAVIEMLLKIGWSLMAIKNGVRRAHIIPPKNGALLQELYTRDGCGLLVSGDIYEGIRRANVNDVAGLFELIQPLVKAGILAQRTKTTLEEDILSYFVYTRDNLIVACAQLHRYEQGYAEIGCLVVDKNYRSQGRGDAMLGYLERLCSQSNIPNVFVLSTQTMQFFVERGFEEVGVDELPPSRRERYNYARRSKIYMKRMLDDRDLDAEELLWNK